MPLSGASADGTRPRLLIADDDPVVRSMMSMALGEAFELVGVAADGEEAIALAGASHPDAALLDVDMPKGGGLGAVRGILEVSPMTAIVVLSGDESDGLVRELVQAGAVAYRRKGVSPHELAASLTESIDVRRRERPVTH
jgi:DNA-binding NarL/FixJ family response regulator